MKNIKGPGTISTVGCTSVPPLKDGHFLPNTNWSAHCVRVNISAKNLARRRVPVHANTQFRSLAAGVAKRGSHYRVTPSSNSKFCPVALLRRNLVLLQRERKDEVCAQFSWVESSQNEDKRIFFCYYYFCCQHTSCQLSSNLVSCVSDTSTAIGLLGEDVCAWCIKATSCCQGIWFTDGESCTRLGEGLRDEPRPGQSEKLHRVAEVVAKSTGKSHKSVR